MNERDQESVGESGSRREDVLAALRGGANAMTIVAIADQLAVHPNTVRFHLGTLVTDGRVERVEPGHNGPGRPPLMFRAVRGMDPGGTRRYRLLAEILTLGFSGDRNASAKALTAGRAWARVTRPTRKAPGVQESINRLVGLLGELGFARSGGNRTAKHKSDCAIARSSNSLREVRRRLPDSPGAHAGALEAWRSPVTVDRLDAFVEPDLCLVHLAPTAAAS